MSLLTTTRPQSLDAEHDLIARLERIIQARTGGHIDQLRVLSTDSGVIITGIAYTYYAKQQATHAALSEVESDCLANCIEVV